MFYSEILAPINFNKNKKFPLDWRTIIHWNVVLAIFQHNTICQDCWKSTRSTFECVVILQSREQDPYLLTRGIMHSKGSRCPSQGFFGHLYGGVLLSKTRSHKFLVPQSSSFAYLGNIRWQPCFYSKQFPLEWPPWVLCLSRLSHRRSQPLSNCQTLTLSHSHSHLQTVKAITFSHSHSLVKVLLLKKCYECPGCHQEVQHCTPPKGSLVVDWSSWATSPVTHPPNLFMGKSWSLWANNCGHKAV